MALAIFVAEDGWPNRSSMGGEALGPVKAISAECGQKRLFLICVN